MRHEITGKSSRGLNKITSGRSNLVSQGIHIAVEHPVVGIGVGGFRRAYAERTGVEGHRSQARRVAHDADHGRRRGRDRRARAALLAVVAALAATLLRLGVGFTSRTSLAIGVALVAITVHSFFYAAFFEDPLTWSLLGLIGVVALVPKKPGRPAVANGEVPPDDIAPAAPAA